MSHQTMEGEKGSARKAKYVRMVDQDVFYVNIIERARITCCFIFRLN